MVGGGKFNILRDLFFDIENSPVAYLPSSRVYSYIKKIYGSDFIRRRDVELFERTYVRPTQILKESRSERKKTLAYFVHGPNLLWQADLVDFQHGPYKFILTVIDVFSKKADAEPITSKSGVKVSDAFRKIGERWGEYPVRLQTDKGKEFFNVSFQNLMREKTIIHYYVSSRFKSAVVESFNRRFQHMIYLYILGGKKMSIKKLVKLVIKNYNRLPHHYHGYAPEDVKGETVDRILESKIKERQEESVKSKKRQKPFKFKIGQTVRTTRLKKTFFKGYRGVFTEEVFVVMDRFRRKPHLDVNLYRLKDLKDRSIVRSVYYEHELLKVELPKTLPIKRVLKHNKKGQKEVTLKDFPPDFSIWM